MQKIRLISLVMVLALLAFGITVEAKKDKKEKKEKEHGGRPISVKLTGKAEVPGPGDPDGTGKFTARLNPGQGQICYELSASKVAAPTAAHIHKGVAGQAGDVVVGLKAPTDGPVKDCVSLDSDKVKDIMQNPSQYYVNVHNAEFKSGAIRGQLGK